jgi:hypothetical protein
MKEKLSIPFAWPQNDNNFENIVGTKSLLSRKN